MRGCLLARHELRVVGWQGERRDRAVLGKPLFFVARKLEGAARVPARLERRPALKRSEKRCARHAREDAVVWRDQRMKSAGVVARRFPCRPGVALEQRDAPSARAQALAYCGASETRADDRCRSLLWN